MACGVEIQSRGLDDLRFGRRTNSLPHAAIGTAEKRSRGTDLAGHRLALLDTDDLVADTMAGARHGEMVIRNVDLGHAQLAVRDAGSGPPLLLVHGFPLDHTMWSGQWDHYQDRYRVLAPDRDVEGHLR